MSVGGCARVSGLHHAFLGVGDEQIVDALRAPHLTAAAHPLCSACLRHSSDCLSGAFRKHIYIVFTCSYRHMLKIIRWINKTYKIIWKQHQKIQTNKQSKFIHPHKPKLVIKTEKENPDYKPKSPTTMPQNFTQPIKENQSGSFCTSASAVEGERSCILGSP